MNSFIALTAFALLLAGEWMSGYGIASGKSSLSAIQGILIISLGGFGITVLLHRLTGRWGEVRASLILMAFLGLMILAMDRNPLFSSSGAYSDLLWPSYASLAASAVLAIFASRRLGYFAGGRGLHPHPLPWGIAVALGLFSLSFLLMFTSGPMIDLALAIRHRTAWKQTALPFLFTNEALTGALAAFAFTWLASKRKVAYFLAGSDLAFKLIVHLWILETPGSWLVRYPWTICAEPLGLLLGGWLAIRWMSRDTTSPDMTKGNGIQA